MVHIDTPAGPIPRHLFPGLRGYIYDRIRPGHLLVALLSDELGAALTYAKDGVSLADLKAIHLFMCTFFPSTSWGSRGNVDRWLGETRALEIERMSRFQDLPDGDERRLLEVDG